MDVEVLVIWPVIVEIGIEELTQVSPNRFEVFKVRVIQRGEGSSKEMAKDRREILRKEKAKRG